MRSIDRPCYRCGRGRARRSSVARMVGLAATLVALVALRGAQAAPTVTVELATFAELDAGKPQGTAVSSRGEVVAGLGQRRLAKLPPATLIWSAVRAADPRTLYLGTGDEARLWAVEGESVRVVAQLDGLVITALARGPGGKLLAAVMPGARVIEVDPATGKWRQLAALPAKHLWALYWDAARDRVVAASGAPGKLFTVALTGASKPAVLFDPKEQHLLCLVPDAAGRLLTGSHDRAVLYRVSPNGRGEALHDFQASELQSVAVGRDGAIFVAVNQFPSDSGGVPRFDVVAKGAGGTPLREKSGEAAAPPKFRAEELRPGAKAAKGALYRLDAQGRLDELLTLPSGYFTRLGLDREGRLWAGEGSEGKVYTVGARRAVQTVFDLPERQVRVLAIEADPPYLATADGAAVYRVLSQPAQVPAYLSKVLDAGLAARWGELYYQATATLEVFSRSGNTATPDDLWTDWQAATPLAAGRVRLVGPNARYLQVKAVWRKPYAGRLRSLKLYYRAINQRARVTEIVATQGGAADGAERRETRIRLRWQLDNPDKDPLVYRVYFRPELGKVWRPIDRQLPPLEKAEYVWETEGIADGLYRLRVVASDELANGPDQTLRHGRISSPVLVDNRPPEIPALRVRDAGAEGTARDAASPIRELAYALDGRRWRLLEPLDGVCDASSEAFRLTLPPRLARGPHTLAVRVRDEAGNVGVRQLEFTR